MARQRDGRLGFGRAFRVARTTTGLALVATLAAAISVGGCSPSPSATAGPPTPAPTIAADARATLDAALAPLAGGSEFQSTVTVDGTVVTDLVGRTIGNSSSLTVTTGDRSVEYVRVPPKAWAREPKATWLVVDAAQAPDSPLTALSAPLTLAPGPGAPSTTLTATYPAKALGLTGDPATVTITLLESGVMFEYQKTASGRTVVSTTTLRPATDTSPIVAPAP